MAPKPLADLGAGLTSKASEQNPRPIQHGTARQIERAFTAASTFFSGMLAISASQFLGAPLKAIDPKSYEAYMAFTKQNFGVLITTMTQWWSPTVVKVSGDTSIPKQLFRKADGSLECKFPKRLVMMANHQLYTDWLYLWWISYTNNMHGHIYIILKESLKNVPIIGWGAQFYNFIFLSRNWTQDQAQFQAHLDQLNKPEDPMWLLIFPEGTNLAKCTREKSRAWAEKSGLHDMKHQLLPRSRGIQFCLQRLRKTTDWLYDCTIAYEGVPEGQYGQDIFTLRSSMFEGRPPKSVNMYFRRFRISTIPLDNHEAFEIWLRNRWREKDYLLEHFDRFNSFPVDDKWMERQQKAGRKQFIAHPARNITTQIKSNSLEEFLSIFAPLTSVLMVVFLLSGGADTDEMIKTLGGLGQKGKLTLDDITKNFPGMATSSPTNKVAAKAAAPDMATMSTINRVTPAAAQKELISKYLESVRPSVPRQMSVSKQAPRKLPIAGPRRALSVNSQPVGVPRALTKGAGPKGTSMPATISAKTIKPEDSRSEASIRRVHVVSKPHAVNKTNTQRRIRG